MIAIAQFVAVTFYLAAAAVAALPFSRRVKAPVGPVILGRAYDSTGSYESLLVLLAGALALAAAINLLLPKYLYAPETA